MQAIVLLLTLVTLRGSKESIMFNRIVTTLNVTMILVFITAGLFYTDFSANFKNFTPYGPGGVLQGGAVLFFCFIGFDAVSTLSEEVRHPQRDIPMGILGTLVITTILYCMAALVLMGMVPYYDVNVKAPLAEVRKRLFFFDDFRFCTSFFERCMTRVVNMYQSFTA